uniref:Uncharacterized protein n=1 Tax=Lepeophtheirus salmonis TaxID=72036 RepID=A0A0K2UP70_LEPSM
MINSSHNFISDKKEKTEGTGI